MVSSLLVDALSSPTNALIQLYNESSDAKSSVPEFSLVVAQHFGSVFAGKDAFCQIPALDAHHPPSSYEKRSLVRFRAMVQDTSPSPEMYLSAVSDKECGGWGLAEDMVPDHREGHANIDYGKLKERSVLWAVSIPGETPWSSQELDAQNTASSNLINFTRTSPLKAHKYPVHNAQHVGAQVKVYYPVAESFKPTEVYTFVGILTSELEQSEFASDNAIPTLHVLFHSPLPRTLVQYAYPSERYDNAVREQLISWFAVEALGNDRDAAEWVLLSCIANVQSRNPPLLPLSLTLSHFLGCTETSDGDIVPTLSHLFSELLPLSVTLPLTLEFINERKFAPESKNEDLHSGVLQIPAGTMVLVTENGIQEGKIVENGVRNLQALQEAIKYQTLHYIFPFSKFSFPTDLNFVILSEGKKSTFCETSVIVPLKPEPSSNLYKPKKSVALPSPVTLTLFRELIIGSKSGKMTVSEEVSQHIQSDFVKERQVDKSISPDDLIHKMTVARLIALSQHESEITMATWARTKELDARRRNRTN